MTEENHLVVHNMLAMMTTCKCKINYDLIHMLSTNLQNMSEAKRVIRASRVN
jgi:hypothetical protein